MADASYPINGDSEPMLQAVAHGKVHDALHCTVCATFHLLVDWIIPIIQSPFIKTVLKAGGNIHFLLSIRMSYFRQSSLAGFETPRPRFENEEEFVTIRQFTKRPIHVLLYPGESFKRFRMINKKAGIKAGNNAALVLNVKETAAKFGVLEVGNWGRFHDRFCMMLDKAKVEYVECVCADHRGLELSPRTYLLPNTFAAAKQEAG